MDMKKNRKWIGALLLITTLVTVGIASSFAQSNETCEQNEKSSMNKLTEEQREALREKMEELREDLQQFMEDMGIDMENCGMMKGFGRRGPMRWFGDEE